MLDSWFMDKERLQQISNEENYQQYITDYLSDISQLYKSGDSILQLEEKYPFEIVQSLYPMIFHEDYHALDLMFDAFPSLPAMASQYIDETKFSLVGFAMDLKNYKMLEYLLTKGVDANKYSDDECSLDAALYTYRDKTVIDLLLKHGAFVPSGLLFLDALEYGEDCFLQCVNVAKAQHFFVDKLNYALAEAKKRNNSHAVQLLIASGAKENSDT